MKTLSGVVDVLFYCSDGFTHVYICQNSSFPQTGAWSYPPLSSFLVTPFFEAGMIKVAQHLQHCLAWSPSTWQVPNDFCWVSQWMNGDINEQEGHQLSGEEAFLGSNFTISSHSHHFFLTKPFLRSVLARFYFCHCSFRHFPYQTGTSAPRITVVSEALLLQPRSVDAHYCPCIYPTDRVTVTLQPSEILINCCQGTPPQPLRCHCKVPLFLLRSKREGRHFTREFSSSVSMVNTD